MVSYRKNVREYVAPYLGPNNTHSHKTSLKTENYIDTVRNVAPQNNTHSLEAFLKTEDYIDTVGIPWTEAHVWSVTVKMSGKTTEKTIEALS